MKLFREKRDLYEILSSTLTKSRRNLLVRDLTNRSIFWNSGRLNSSSKSK